MFKKTLLILIIVLLITTVAMAASTNAKRNAGTKFSNTLGLSQDQISQIKEITAKYRTDAKEIAKSNLSREDKSVKLSNLRKAATDAIMAVLTPEQREKAQKMGLTDKMLRAKRNMNMKPRNKMSCITQLNLSEQQKAEIKAIMQNTRTQVQAIRNDSNLSPEAKRSKIKEIRDASKAKIMSILTPEQRQKLDELKKNCPSPIRKNRPAVQ